MANRNPKGLESLIIAALLLGACARASAAPTPATSQALGTPAAPIPSRDPRTLTYYTSSGDPETLDTAFDYETMGGMIIQNMYDTLIFYNKDKADKFVPQLATDVPSQANGGISADGKTYTFTIRTGVKFHNGDNLTPDDVAYTFQRGLLQGGLKSPQWLLFQPILGVAASPSGNNDITDLVDPSGKLGSEPGDPLKADLLKADPAKLLAACQAVTSAIVAADAANNGEAGSVTFHLAQPWGPFLASLANAWGSIVDKKWIAANGGWDGDCHTWQNFYQTTLADLNNLKLSTSENGTGPYQLDHWTAGQEIVLKAFDGYWRTQPAWTGGPAGAPKLKSIVVKLDMGQLSDRLAGLSSGQADVIDPGSPTDWPKMDALVGETCPEVNLCSAAAGSGKPLRVIKNLPAASRYDVFFNFKIDTTGGNDFIGSGQLDGNGIPPDFFDDAHVRRAFNDCFDWATYLKEAQLGEGLQSFDVMLPGEIGYSDQDPHYSFDPNKCKSELQESALKSADGRSLWDTGFRMIVGYDTGNTQRQTVAQILSQDLKAVNPKFVIVPSEMPAQTWSAAQQAHKLPLWATNWLEDIHDPHDWVAVYVTGTFGQQQSLPRDLAQPLAVFINQGVQQTDPAKRAAIYQQFNQAFYNAAPDILLTVQNGRQYEQRWVQGYFFTPSLGA